jgi:hypothetical protein
VADWSPTDRGQSMAIAEPHGDSPVHIFMATYRLHPHHGSDWMNGPTPLERGLARRVPRFDPANPGHVRLRRLERLSWLLDRAIPVGRFRVGLDPILGLIPGLGDSIGALLSLYILYEGARLGAPALILLRMTGNIVFDTIVGAIPVLGDAFDFVWQANARNVRLIHRHHAPKWRPRSLRAVWFSVICAATLVLTVAGTVAWWIFHVLSAIAHHASAF